MQENDGEAHEEAGASGEAPAESAAQTPPGEAAGKNQKASEQPTGAETSSASATSGSAEEASAGGTGYAEEEPDANVDAARVNLLKDVITKFTFKEQGTVTEEEVRLLSQVRPDPSAPPIPEAARAWLGEGAWACCRSLEQLKSFKNTQASLLQNFDQDALGWARPDRMMSALRQFVAAQLGQFFVETPAIDMREIEKEADRHTPLFIVLFPGVDPTPVIEGIAKSKNCTATRRLKISRTIYAEQSTAFLRSMKSTSILLRRAPLGLEQGDSCLLSGSSAKKRAIYGSAPRYSSVCNVAMSMRTLTQEIIDSCARPREFKALLFSLCYFHSLVIGRKKFGFLGWSRSYSFNEGDLTICGNVIRNYLDKYATIPFEDIRYILGEIMYGGHITDNFDRRLNNSYLAKIILPEVLQSYQLAPSFRTPDPAKTDFAAYQKFVEEKTPPENPQEVAGVGGGGGGNSRKEDVVLVAVASLLAKVPLPFDIAGIRARTKDFQPATVVCLQRQQYHRYAVRKLMRVDSAAAVAAADAEIFSQGALNVTDAMEQLSTSLYFGRVPEAWKAYAYESRKPLTPWYFRKHDKETPLL
ncbi:hypothetical protein ACSSS7_005707 [Eimeria intestinalis]